MTEIYIVFLLSCAACVSIVIIIMQGYRTPLHYAANMGHNESVALLVSNGADVNVKDNVSY